MTFEAYLTAIKSKTGRTPEQLKADATKAGVYTSNMKATELVSWLKTEHDLGHGHSMAVWAVWKSKGWVQAPTVKKK
jgi:Domain of unknown function (DUF4287)